MNHPRLIHDHALALAQVLLDQVAPHYPEAAHRDRFAEFYQAARAALQHYDHEIARMHRRLNPMH